MPSPPSALGFVRRFRLPAYLGEQGAIAPQRQMKLSARGGAGTVKRPSPVAAQRPAFGNDADNPSDKFAAALLTDGSQQDATVSQAAGKLAGTLATAPGTLARVTSSAGVSWFAARRLDGMALLSEEKRALLSYMLAFDDFVGEGGEQRLESVLADAEREQVRDVRACAAATISGPSPMLGHVRRCNAPQGGELSASGMWAAVHRYCTVS